MSRGKEPGGVEMMMSTGGRSRYSGMTQRAEDIRELHERLFLFGLSVCRALRAVQRDFVTDHFAHQLVRCATSPAGNYAEARGAESKRDFIHKMQLCLKELRETDIWLRFLSGLTALDWSVLRNECNELTAIFVTSIKTAKKNGSN